MQHILAVSGVKNSGKTTLIDRMISFFTKEGLKVAVIKHDGHEFEADVPGKDSWKHKRAGAYGTAVFSATKYMIVKEEPEATFEMLAACFPEADLILLEGGKFSDLPKIELVRREISREPVCAPEHVLAYVTDLLDERDLKILPVSLGLSCEPDQAASLNQPNSSNFSQVPVCFDWLAGKSGSGSPGDSRFCGLGSLDPSAGPVSDRENSRMRYIPPWMQSSIPVFGFVQVNELCTYLLKKILKSDKIDQ